MIYKLHQGSLLAVMFASNSNGLSIVIGGGIVSDMLIVVRSHLFERLHC